MFTLRLSSMMWFGLTFWVARGREGERERGKEREREREREAQRLDARTLCLFEWESSLHQSGVIGLPFVDTNDENMRCV